MLYLSSPIGLGHARRDLAIARELRELHPGLQVDWLPQHPATELLARQGERIHPAPAFLVSESQHLEGECAERDLHVSRRPGPGRRSRGGPARRARPASIVLAIGGPSQPPRAPGPPAGGPDSLAPWPTRGWRSRYRSAVSYGLHAPLAAPEMTGTDCEARLGVTAGTARS